MDKNKSEEKNYRRGNKKRLRLNVRRQKNLNLKNWRKKYTEMSAACSNQEVNVSLFDKSNKTENSPSKQISTACRRKLFSDEGSQIYDNDVCTQEVLTEHANSSTKYIVEGRRIVEFQFLFDCLKEISNHNEQMGCTLSNINITKELRTGLNSTFVLRCNMCNASFQLHSDTEKVDVNECAVAGIMNIGSGFSHMEAFLSSLNIPAMNKRYYSKLHNRVCEAWQSTAEQAMKIAAEEEKQIAIRNKNLDTDGTPLIRVVCDGSWAKRSYRTNYSSLSGVGAIVGYNTKKVLYIGVKNKYCSICTQAENANKQTPEHQCFKNWSGSSTSMEAAAITEGFLKSEELYGVRYHQMIADGDSSCYKKILDAKPYKNLTVQKIECRNHLLRNMCNKLKDISNQTKAGSAFLRKILATNILRCRSAVTKAVQHWKTKNVAEHIKITELRKDILNVVSHVFGEHKNCKNRQYFCIKECPDEENIVNEFEKYTILESITTVFQCLAQHAKSLIIDVDSNYVEQFNSIICKFIGGKRINFTMRQSYQARCSAAVVSQNTRKPFSEIYKHLSGSSPGKYVKRNEENRIKVLTNRKYNIVKKKRSILALKQDEHYGLNCQKEDLNEDEYEINKKDFLSGLATTTEQRDIIEMKTRLQRDSSDWFNERSKLLTSSTFGLVCRRLPHTSCQNMVKEILYTTVRSKATFWGQIKESFVKIELKEKYGYKINDCGLIVDSQLPFLGASPDGLIDLDGVLEIKCPYSARTLTPEEGIVCKKIKFWVKQKEQLIINKKHYWYYQIQGQLHITKRNYCLLVVWTPLGIKFEKIVRNDVFWKQEMEEKFVKFYEHCLLPEILDPRFKRNMPIRDPAFIKEAQKKKISKSTT